MLRTTSRFLSVAAVSLAVAPAALAQRDGTDREYAQIARALHGHANCIVVRVSTVNRKWATAMSSGETSGCAVADGVLGMRRLSHGRWAVKYEGPVDPTTRCRYVRPVPPHAARDLLLCR